MEPIGNAKATVAPKEILGKYQEQYSHKSKYYHLRIRFRMAKVHKFLIYKVGKIFVSLPLNFGKI
jgi:hypothetical protein